MRRKIHRILASRQREPRASNRRDRLKLTCLLAALSCCYFARIAAADEAGTSFWLPGQYGSFAAVPSEPGCPSRIPIIMRLRMPAVGSLLNAAVGFKPA